MHTVGKVVSGEYSVRDRQGGLSWKQEHSLGSSRQGGASSAHLEEAAGMTNTWVGQEVSS